MYEHLIYYKLWCEPKCLLEFDVQLFICTNSCYWSSWFAIYCCGSGSRIDIVQMDMIWSLLKFAFNVQWPAAVSQCACSKLEFVMKRKIRSERILFVFICLIWLGRRVQFSASFNKNKTVLFARSFGRRQQQKMKSFEMHVFASDQPHILS